jgi:hypothetical protein
MPFVYTDYYYTQRARHSVIPQGMNLRQSPNTESNPFMVFFLWIKNKWENK